VPAVIEHDFAGHRGESVGSAASAVCRKPHNSARTSRPTVSP
jgi:hypothetical protein